MGPDRFTPRRKSLIICDASTQLLRLTLATARYFSLILYSKRMTGLIRVWHILKCLQRKYYGVGVDGVANGFWTGAPLLAP